MKVSELIKQLERLEVDQNVLVVMEGTENFIYSSIDEIGIYTGGITDIDPGTVMIRGAHSAVDEVVDESD